MRTSIAFVLFASVACRSIGSTAVDLLAAPPACDLAEWTALKEGDYALPPDVPRDRLLERVRAALAAEDPRLRDEVLYDLMRHWLFPASRFTEDELRAHAAGLVAQLAVPTRAAPSGGDESVLLRSFSALHLSLLAASDLRHPFLDDAGWRALFEAAVGYLAAEHDVRGYVAGTGWHHSVAHTADLLKFLARSERLGAADQARVIATIEAKLGGVPCVLAWGEDERLAAVLVALVERDDFEFQTFEAWLARECTRRAAVWSTQPFDPARFVAAQNARNVLVSLHLALAGVDAPSPEVQAALAAVLASLRS
ncbi:MAG: DUF2785 domain-containing protein [Planctomycetes bacterium]|nr:DUF2785 domain-containing protein [Planctomycetota bacterium]